jgi:hypothetical protein
MGAWYHGAVGLTLEVSYGSAAGLLLDYEQQLRVGGLFAQCDTGGDLPPFAEIKVVLQVQGAPRIEVPARVTVVTADNVCVEIAAEAREVLAGQVAALCQDVRAAADRTGARLLRESARPAMQHTQLSLDKRIATMSVSEKVQLALHGNRDERMLLMKDRAGVVQASLVRNAKSSLDEITALARASHLAPDAAEVIASHPSHRDSAQIAAALVRNPRTPLPTAIDLVAKLSPSDLRAVAKGLNVRMQVAQAARKRLLGDRG